VKNPDGWAADDSIPSGWSDVKSPDGLAADDNIPSGWSDVKSHDGWAANENIPNGWREILVFQGLSKCLQPSVEPNCTPRMYSSIHFSFRDTALYDESGVVCDHGLLDGGGHPVILDLPYLNDTDECQNYQSHPEAIDWQPPAHHVCWSWLSMSSCVPLLGWDYVNFLG
jgi:uncharacterized protein YbdZ (MbtH family)